MYLHVPPQLSHLSPILLLKHCAISANAGELAKNTQPATSNCCCPMDARGESAPREFQTDPFRWDSCCFSGIRVPFEIPEDVYQKYSHLIMHTS